MNQQRIRTPHTFDMSNYFTGQTCVVGGRDFELEEKETPKDQVLKSEKKVSLELDWSFLKNLAKNRSF